MYTGMDNLFYESHLRHEGYSLIAGVDEAGRGPLAGPVVAAAVILPDQIILDGVRDSKKMSAKAREKAFLFIQSEAVGISLAVIGPKDIDKINILQATLLAMKKAVLSLNQQPDFILIDGAHHIDLPIHQRCIVKGDQLSLTISSASVLAKVYRDRIMCSYHNLYPQYGFSLNKGYGTSQHLNALAKYGPCSIHRLTFRHVSS